MAEEIAFENGRISNFQGLVTLTLTLDWVILHTVVHHSSTSRPIYMPNFIKIKETFCGWTDIRKYICTDEQTFETQFIRSTQNSRSNNKNFIYKQNSVFIWR